MIISGKELSAKMKAAMAEEVKTFPEKYGRVPHLAVILVGDESDNLPCHCERYEKLFAERGFKNVRFAHEPISKNKLQSIVDALCRIVETYEDCVFGLTGGEDLYLVAMGIVCERYREKNLKMHRFLLSEGYILDCDQDGQTIGKNRQPKLSVEENIRLYGGEVNAADAINKLLHIGLPQLSAVG